MLAPTPKINRKRTTEGQFSPALSSLCAHCSTFARDGLETGLDAGHGTSRAAGFALQEEEARVFLQDGVGRATCVAGDVLFDVSTGREGILLCKSQRNMSSMSLPS